MIAIILPFAITGSVFVNYNAYYQQSIVLGTTRLKSSFHIFQKFPRTMSARPRFFPFLNCDGLQCRHSYQLFAQISIFTNFVFAKYIPFFLWCNNLFKDLTYNIRKRLQQYWKCLNFLDTNNLLKILKHSYRKENIWSSPTHPHSYRIKAWAHCVFACR